MEIGLILAGLALWIWAIIDIARNKFPGRAKMMWLLLVVFTSTFGAVFYLIFGRRERLDRVDDSE